MSFGQWLIVVLCISILTATTWWSGFLCSYFGVGALIIWTLGLFHPVLIVSLSAFNNVFRRDLNLCVGEELRMFRRRLDHVGVYPRNVFAFIFLVDVMHGQMASVAIWALVSGTAFFARRESDEAHKRWTHELFFREGEQAQLANLEGRVMRNFQRRLYPLMIWWFALLSNATIFLWAFRYRKLVLEVEVMWRTLWALLTPKPLSALHPGMSVGVYAVRTSHRWLVPQCAKVLHSLVGKNWCWLYSKDYLCAHEGLVKAVDIAKNLDHVIVVVPENGEACEALDWVQIPLVVRDFIRLGSPVEDTSEEKVRDFEYALRIIDEDFVATDEGELAPLIHLSVLELNRKVAVALSRSREEMRYSSGVFDLNVLHRRVHEFPEAASRFLELLNVWELVARWMVAVEGVEEYEREEETLRISFGKTCSDIRKTAFMQSKLGVPEDGKLMDEVREYWKEAFNWKASMSQNPTVEEAFGWMVYIRNKTRGHGSTSRIKEELYIVVEALTFLLLDRVKDHADLEIMVRDVKEDGTVFFTCRHGMRLDFIEAEDSLVSTLVDAESNVHFRKVGQEDWRTSNLLKAEKGHVFLLNEIRKGHREWVCFSTGELIRPASIFDA